MAAVRIVVGESDVPIIAPMEQDPVVITVPVVQGLLAPGPPPALLTDEPDEGES